MFYVDLQLYFSPKETSWIEDVENKMLRITGVRKARNNRRFGIIALGSIFRFEYH
jgi:hypothetical protein